MSITARDLHERHQDRPVTATIVIAANTGKLPWLDLHDPALRERCKVIPYPRVPDDVLAKAVRRIPAEAGMDFLTWMQTPARAAGVLARLVWECSRLSTYHAPPTAPAAVARATDELSREDGGELGQFATRFVPGEARDRVTVPDAWSAWCSAVGGDPSDREVGGIKRMTFARHLRQHVPHLPSPKNVRLADGNGGGTVRAWDRWRLLVEEPVPPWERPGLEPTEAVFAAATSTEGVAALLAAAEDAERADAPESTWTAGDLALPRERRGPTTRNAAALAAAAGMAKWLSRSGATPTDTGYYLRVSKDPERFSFGFHSEVVRHDPEYLRELRDIVGGQDDPPYPPEYAQVTKRLVLSPLHSGASPRNELRLFVAVSELRRLDGRADDLVVLALADIETRRPGETALGVVAAACGIPSALIEAAQERTSLTCPACGRRVESPTAPCPCGELTNCPQCGAAVRVSEGRCRDCGLE